ncbi:MAG: 3'-5' exonuclease, partial [Pseudomonadota bacterium]
GRAPGETLWHRLAIATQPEVQAARAFCETHLAQRHLSAFEFLNQALTTRRAGGLSGWDRLIQRLGEPVRDPVQALLSLSLSFDMSEARSLQRFLADIEGRNTVLKRELGEPDAAVRVMTVHGAKGLQAPVVILPDTTSGTKPVSEALFFTDAGIPLYSPSARFDCKATAHLRETANLAAERESRRLLYVALTRASDQLIIAGASLGNSKQGYAKSSWYRWCLTAMQALLGGNIDETDLQAPLVYGAPPICVAKTESADRQAPPAPDWLKRAAQMPAPPQRLAAPSRLLEDRSAVLAPFGRDRAAALKRGRLIHALLQTLPDLPPDARQAAGRKFLARDPELTPVAAEEMLAVTLRVFAEPSLASLFSTKGRNEAAIVGTLPGGQLVNGRVDRLIIEPDQILILDYKTDRPAPKDAQSVDASYLVQMAAYRAVLQTLYPERAVNCALLYTDGPHLIELEGHVLSESLNRVESRV